MRRPSLDAVRGFDRAVYVVAGGQLVNVLGSGLVYPFATVHFHLEVGIALSLVGVGLLANNVALAAATAVRSPTTSRSRACSPALRWRTVRCRMDWTGASRGKLLAPKTVRFAGERRSGENYWT